MTPEEFQMAISGELEQQDSPEQFNALLNPLPVRGPITNTRYAAQAAMLGGAPYDVQGQQLLAQTDDTKAFRRQQAEAWFDARITASAQAIQNTLYGPSETVEAVTTAQAENIRALTETRNHPLAPELAYTVQAAPNGQSDQFERLSLRLAMANDLGEMVEEQGWLETGADFLGMVVTGGEIFDIANIDDVVREKPELAEIAGQELEDIIGNWKALPVERQAALWPPLKEAIIQATESFGVSDGNLLKASSLLQKFLGAEAGDEMIKQQVVDGLFLAADLTPVSAIRAMKPVEKLSAAAILKRASRDAVDNTSAVKMAADAGDITTAAEHTVASIADPDVATVLGTTKTEAALDALPLETEEWFTRVTNSDAMPSAVAGKMNEIAAKANGFSTTLTEESGLMQIGAVYGTDRTKVMRNFQEKMDYVGEEYLTQNIQMDNLRILKEDKTGFEYSYTLQDKNMPLPEGSKPRLKLVQGSVKFRINDVTGDFVATTNDPLAQSGFTNFLSPAAWAKRTEDGGDFGQEVTMALQADELRAAYTARVNDMIRWAVEPIDGIAKGAHRSRVSAVLEKGDEFIDEATQIQGRVFSPEELAAGIEVSPTTAKTHGLKDTTVRLTSPEEVEAYYRFRFYADAAFEAENHVLRREKELAGFKDIKMFALADNAEQSAAVNNLRRAAHAIGKPYDEMNQALASVRGKAGQGVWDDNLGRTVDISDDYVRQVYEEGDILARLEKDWNTKGTGDLDGSGEFVQYVRVKRNHVNDLPDRVLHYRQGYVPKINQAKYTVSQRMPMIARNRPNMFRTQALRAFDSLADAKVWREEQVVKFMAKHKVARGEAERMFTDVEALEQGVGAARLEDAVGAHTGLYHGTRSKDQLLFGLSGQQLSRVPPLEAYQRHAQHLGTFVSMNEIRIAREKKWLNTVRQMLPDADIKGFQNTLLPPGNKQAEVLEKMRTKIKEWNGIPTRDEQLFSASMQRVHDWMLYGARKFGYANKESVKSMQWLMHKDPYSAIKSAVMHNLLGFLNVRQLYLQASAMSVALAKNPLQAGYALRHAIPMTLLDNIRDPKALEGAYGVLKRAGVASDETIDLHRTWLRTGLRETVDNNSDIAHIAQTGYGITAKLARGFDQTSLFLWRGGELAARRVTFGTEFAAWQRRTGKTIPTDAELATILEEVHKSLLELGPANRAWWQGGQGTGALRQTLGVATQFMQVGAKTMELVLKNEGRSGFTKAEKMRILAGQTFLFGAVGVPMGGLMTQYLMKAAGIEEMDQNLANAINQGFNGFAANLILDPDGNNPINASGDIALGGAVTQMVKDFIESDDPLWIKMAGPAATGLFGRTYDAMKELKVLSSATWEGHMELDMNAMRLGWSILADVTSSGRNWTRYDQMKNLNKIMDRRYNVISARDFDYGEEVAAIFGLNSLRTEMAQDLMMDRIKVQERIDAYAQTKASIIHKAIFELKLDDDAMLGVYAALQLHDEATDPYIQVEGNKRYIERIFGTGRQTKEDREMQKFIERTAVKKISEDMVLDSNTPISQELPIIQPFKLWLDAKATEEE